MIKLIKLFFSFLKKIIYFNDLKKIKTDTWKSKRVVEKFYNIHNVNQKDIFHRINSNLFSNYVEKNDKVLDVGCGTGRLLNILREQSNQCYGLDVSEEMISKISDKKNLFVGSVFDMPFEDNFFDVVTSMDLMVHFEDVEKILKEKLRVTKKNGKIIFNIGSQEHYDLSKKIYGERFNAVYENNTKSLSKPYYKTISDSELSIIGKKFGYEIIKSIPYNFFISNILFTSACLKNNDLNKKFMDNFNEESFFQFINFFEKNIINNSDPSLTFYKIIVLKKN